ncbi:MAG TPA: hypothetical protein PKM63_11295 [Panacibacter sp.]|nr:hypothetical protein [Panacibacter sp.]HNP44863.1 hypothetical protein [Panacibacter sp.]
MTKRIRNKKYSGEDTAPLKLQEPVIAEYKPLKRLAIVAEFPFKKFEKIASLVPFTQKEWANMLHLSERTLQRYAKYNTSFEGIYVDRILHLEQMIHTGLETFVKADAFYSWLKREKNVLGNLIRFESLYSTQGINDITEELGRIQHGVYI